MSDEKNSQDDEKYDSSQIQKLLNQIGNKIPTTC